MSHHIRTDELAFQITMIAFSGTLFVSSLNREFSLISEALSKVRRRSRGHRVEMIATNARKNRPRCGFTLI